METCPAAPGPIELLVRWGEGERGMMETLALCGFLYFVFFIAWLAFAVAGVH
jgi:hypothetical protein